MSDKRNHAKIDRFLNRARVAITNARGSSDILAALRAFGYDEARLQTGADLLAAAEALQIAQVRQYGAQYQTTAALRKARQAAVAQYTIHRTLARLVFKGDTEPYKALLLHEKRQRNLSDWLRQAETFYTNALADAGTLATLARYNLTLTDLQAAQATVQGVADLYGERERIRSEAQKATRERDAALEALRAWLSELRVVARIALADDAQMLEALQFGPVA